MNERIQQIIDHEGVKPGEFAEQIGINRSAISHILNKRNNPSLDVVNKILTRYDYIDTDWLLFGKGSMQKKHSNTEKTDLAQKSLNRQQLSLFEDISDKTKIQKPQEVKKELQESPSTIEKEIPVTEINQLKAPEVKEIQIPVNKKITKLIIFYSDNTFDTFAPDKGIF